MTTELAPDIKVEQAETTLYLRLIRPGRLNALTTEMLDELTTHVKDTAAADSVRALVVTGSGRAFSSGADLAVAAAETELSGPTTDTIDAANRLVLALCRLPKPVVAAVNGPAVGVARSIALACDLVVAKESAHFLLAFTNIGLMPDGGATALIPTAIGRMRAARMAMLAERSRRQPPSIGA